MKARRSLVAAGLVALALACATAVPPPAKAQQQQPPSQGGGGNKVTEDEKTWPLPFGLKEEELPEVEMSLALYTTKTGAGYQKVTVWGSGRVQLWRTLSFNSEPQILEGKVPVSTVVRLLDLAEAEGIDGFKEIYEAEEQPAGRTYQIKLKRPGHEKTVSAQDWEVQPVARVSGALRLVAALGRPEAIGDRFFKNF